MSPQKVRVLENGLVGGHAYTLTGIRKVGGTSPFLSLQPPPSLLKLLTKTLVSVTICAQCREANSLMGFTGLLKQMVGSPHLCPGVKSWVQPLPPAGHHPGPSCPVAAQPISLPALLASRPFFETLSLWAATDDFCVWDFPPKFLLLSQKFLFISLSGYFHCYSSFKLC